MLRAQLRRLEGWCRRQARDLVNLLLVEGLARDERLRKRVECGTVFRQQPACYGVAVADNLQDFRIDYSRRFLAERLRAGETNSILQIGILPRRELHHAELLTHAPARDHLTGEVRHLLDVAF